LDNAAVTVPYLQRLRDPAVRQRHWDMLSRVVHTTLDPNSPDLRLKNLFDVNLSRFTHEVEDLLASAQKEADIEQKVAKVAEDFASRTVVLAAFKARGNLVLKSDTTAELLTDLDESQTLLNSLMTSRFNEAFKHSIATWLTRLQATQQRVELWLDVQRSWVYMEAVFVSSGDIGREMPQEVKRFLAIDRQWAKLMAQAEESPNLIKLCTPGEALANTLPQLQSLLEICQRSLVGYMNNKRVAFPRPRFAHGFRRWRSWCTAPCQHAAADAVALQHACTRRRATW
jgi:dynein heavy chain